MTKGESVETTAGNSFTVKCHIGYNVNGAHNGVWLPGNYAIRRSGSQKQSPVSGTSWSGLEASHADWQMHYAAAVSKATKSQFHDAHTEYNESAKKLLNKIATVLFAHQDFCDDCKSKSEIPPPFLIKERLYNISAYLKGQVLGVPQAWKRPWMASDRWREAAFLGGDIKPEFIDAYQAARLEDDS